jgi:hypothetical protein
MKKFFIETFKGVTGDVSAKRATAFFFTAVLVFSLHIAYIIYMFLHQTLEYFTYVLYGYLGFIALLLGLATMENITGLINSIKGYAKNNNNNTDTTSINRNNDRTSSTQESENTGS